jgi:hypothetical protein
MISLLAADGHLPIYWHLPILIVVISLVYSATRFEEWTSICHEAFRWGRNITVFLVGVAIVLYVLASLI